MAQELTKATGTAADTRRRSARIDALYAAIGRDERTLADTLPAPLDAATRKELESHRRELHARLRPIGEAQAEKERAGAAIGALLGAYPNLRSADPGRTLQLYTATVGAYPLFAVLEAVDDFRNGRVYDVNAEGERVPFTLDYAPSAPRLLAQVKKRADPLFEERHKVVRLLGITKFADPEISDAEREKVSELIRGLADEMKIGAATIRAQERQKIRAEADAARDRAARIKHEAALRRATA